MKNIIQLSIIFVTLFSCGQKQDLYVLYSGHIKNSEETTIKMSNNGRSFEKEVTIDADGNFKDTLYIDGPGSYFYQIGKSYSTVFLKNGYDLTLSIDADNFYRATKFTGIGSEVNNYNVARGTLKNKLVGDAKIFFVVPVDDFLVKIQKNKEAFLELLETSSLRGEDKVLQRKVVEYDYLLTRYNYDKFNHYHTKEHPELPEGYYDPIRGMNMDDEGSFNNIKSYRNLVIENWRLTSKEEMAKDPNLTLVNFVEGKIKDIKSTKIKDQIVSMLFRQMSLKNKNYEKDYPRIMAMLSSYTFSY